MHVNALTGKAEVPRESWGCFTALNKSRLYAEHRSARPNCGWGNARHQHEYVNKLRGLTSNSQIKISVYSLLFFAIVLYCGLGIFLPLSELIVNTPRPQFEYFPALQLSVIQSIVLPCILIVISLCVWLCQSNTRLLWPFTVCVCVWTLHVCV